MKTKAVIFDKDGTLIDFDSFWVTVSEYAVREMLETLKCENIPIDEILYELGVRNGVTSVNGALCCGTYKDMAEKIYGVLEKYNCNVTYEETEALTLELHKKHINKGVVKASCPDIRGFLGGLKARGLILAVVTTDVLSITKHCLSALEIEEYFDEIYTCDSGFHQKPAPDAAFDLCKRYKLNTREIVMVGDTQTDINFAKNAGMRIICVAKSEENKQILQKEADEVVPDISYISI